jgi:predicted ester cyclase
MEFCPARRRRGALLDAQRRRACGDTDLAVIPTLSVLAARHLRRDSSEADAKRKPAHPAVEFVLGAWNTGDFDRADEFVAPDCATYVNGFPYDSRPDGDGAAMARQSAEYWRTVIPDLEMELLDEVRHRDRIAIEWLITGTHTGERPELGPSGDRVEVVGAAFLVLEKHKIVEARTVFDALALLAALGQRELLEAAAGPPGRSAE